MYKIGIVGHSPEKFSDTTRVERRISEIIDTLSFQYGDEVVYNISVDIGVGLWAAKHCLNTNKKYHLFLAHSPEVMSKHWYNDQSNDLHTVYKFAKAISIVSPSTDDKDTMISDNTVNEHIVQNSNFTVVIWDGRRQGLTFETINYSFKHNRIIIDGDNLQIITKDYKK